MKIVVCVKQVPDTSDIKWTENNTIQREGVESIINPFDMYALETGLRLKDLVKNAQVAVVSMGPPQAESMLKKAISIGCDKGILLSDRKFAAADTVATSKTLASAIKQKISDFDLIICGQFATDGDTAQTGPSIASHLNIPQITYVKEIQEIKDGVAVVKREVEDGNEIVSVKLPALLCMLKCDYEPRRPVISGFVTAHNSNIDVFSADDLSLNPEEIGMKGSPTYVSKAFRPEQKEGGEVIHPENSQKAVEMLFEKLKEYGVK